MTAIQIGYPAFAFPTWVGVSILIGGIVLALFLAFHDVRVQRDNALAEAALGKRNKFARLQELYEKGIQYWTMWEDAHPAGPEAWQAEVEAWRSRVDVVLQAEFPPPLASEFRAIPVVGPPSSAQREQLMEDRLKFISGVLLRGRSDAASRDT
jgi:hypothetical protein